MSIQIINNAITGEHGVQTRVRNHSRYFSIRKYGDDAMRLAKEAEAMLLADLTLPIRGTRRLSRPNRRNTSGIVGITFNWCGSPGCDKEYAYVRGHSTRPDGTVHVFGYSMHANGIKGAMELALAARVRGGYAVPTLEVAISLAEAWLDATM